MRLSAGFLLRFFALAAALFALWSFGGAGDLYARAVIAATNPLMRVMSGFWVSEVRPREGGVDVFIRSAATAGRPDEIVPFQPREQFSGLIPFLALLGATTGLSWRRRLRALAIGLSTLTAINIARLIILTVIASRYPDWFAYFHEYFFQGLFIALLAFLASMWTEQVRRATVGRLST